MDALSTPPRLSLIDSHCHFDSDAPADALRAELQRARQSGLCALIAAGTKPQDWAFYRLLRRAHRGFVYYAAGLHPQEVPAENPQALLEGLPAFFEGEDAALAVGEIGLDYHCLPADKAAADALKRAQRQAFALQLEMARRYALAVVVHAREAFEDALDILRESRVDMQKVVFHCFAEGAPQMKRLNALGARGSFTGVLTYKNAQKTREALCEQGLERLMLETDSPYLAPVPLRGKKNEPAYLAHTARFAAECLGVSAQELAARTLENTRRFYRLP